MDRWKRRKKAIIYGVDISSCVYIDGRNIK